MYYLALLATKDKPRMIHRRVKMMSESTQRDWIDTLRQVETPIYLCQLGHSEFARDHSVPDNHRLCLWRIRGMPIKRTPFAFIALRVVSHIRLWQMVFSYLIPAVWNRLRLGARLRLVLSSDTVTWLKTCPISALPHLFTVSKTTHVLRFTDSCTACSIKHSPLLRVDTVCRTPSTAASVAPWDTASRAFSSYRTTWRQNQFSKLDQAIL